MSSGGVIASMSSAACSKTAWHFSSAATVPFTVVAPPTSWIASVRPTAIVPTCVSYSGLVSRSSPPPPQPATTTASAAATDRNASTRLIRGRP